MPHAKEDFDYSTYTKDTNFVVRINFNDPKDKARHDEMVGIVERMLELQKHIPCARIPHEKTVLQNQIDAIAQRSAAEAAFAREHLYRAEPDGSQCPEHGRLRFAIFLTSAGAHSPECQSEP